MDLLAITSRIPLWMNWQRRVKTTLLQVLVTLVTVQANAIAEAADNSWQVPRTEYGHPDLQGLWTSPTQTPFQRPVELGTRQAYTAAEAKQMEEDARAKDAKRSRAVAADRPPPPVGGKIGAQADQDFEVVAISVAQVNGEFRTSLIIDPPNGRLPLREDATDIRDNWFAQGFDQYDGPEIRSGQERCLNAAGQLPLLFISFNEIDGDNPLRNIQIVQNEDYVVILSEYFSAVRIIRLNSEHIDTEGGKWRGDSIGWYEGDSLKIHTKGFRAEQTNSFIKSSAQLEISETYTPISENELLFSYTLSDPAIYHQTYTAEIPLQRMEAGKKIYEYACHEGNYSLPSILQAARIAEQQKK